MKTLFGLEGINCYYSERMNDLLVGKSLSLKEKLVIRKTRFVNLKKYINHFALTVINLNYCLIERMKYYS